MASEKSEQESPLELAKKPKKRRIPFRSADRWLIAGLFLLTVLASLFFYFRNQAATWWQKWTSPLVISNVSEKKTFDSSPVLKQIEALTKDLRGVYGIYVYRLDDGEEYGIHQKEVFPAASLMKLPVMLTLYQQAEKGKLDLETEYVLKEADKHSIYTYRQLAEFMGQYSDNTANNILIKVLGSEKIQKTIANLGMKKTSFKEYETTLEDIGLFFRQLYQNELVSFEHREEILKFLTKTGFEDRIPTGVPQGIRVAHKIGTEIGAFSDAGIVFAPKPFVLVIMSKNAKESEAKEALPKITEKVWEFENSK